MEMFRCQCILFAGLIIIFICEAYTFQEHKKIALWFSRYFLLLFSFSELSHSRKCCVLRCFIINEFIGGLGAFTSADIASRSHTFASKNASIIRLSITTARVWQTVFLSNHRLAQATRETPWGGAACTEQGTEARQTVHFHIHDRVYVNILNEQSVALNNTG